MISNYFEDLWEKADKLGINKKSIGTEVFGEKYYRYIYLQGKVTPHMKKRYEEISVAIDRIAKRRKK